MNSYVREGDGWGPEMRGIFGVVTDANLLQ